MTLNPACCTVETKLADVAILMIDNNCGEIPVVNNHEEKKLVGVISDRSICYKAVARRMNPAVMSAKDCMVSPAITIGLDTSLEDCYQYMEKHSLQRITVIDDKGCCCGMVSFTDLIKEINDQLPRQQSLADLIEMLAKTRAN